MKTTDKRYEQQLDAERKEWTLQMVSEIANKSGFQEIVEQHNAALAAERKNVMQDAEKQLAAAVEALKIAIKCGRGLGSVWRLKAKQITNLADEKDKGILRETRRRAGENLSETTRE